METKRDRRYIRPSTGVGNVPLPINVNRTRQQVRGATQLHTTDFIREGRSGVMNAFGLCTYNFARGFKKWQAHYLFGRF